MKQAIPYNRTRCTSNFKNRGKCSSSFNMPSNTILRRFALKNNENSVAHRTTRLHLLLQWRIRYISNCNVAFRIATNLVATLNEKLIIDHMAQYPHAIDLRGK